MKEKTGKLEFDFDLCIQCGACENICPRNLIDYKNKKLDGDICINCFQCYSVCKQQVFQVEGHTNKKRESGNITGETFFKLIKNRRSVRYFQERDVEEKILRDIAATVRFAPTAANTQPVEVTIVSGREAVKELGQSTALYFKKLTRSLNKITAPLYSLFFGKKLLNKLFYIRNLVKDFDRGNNRITHNAPALLIFHSPPSQMQEFDTITSSSYSMLYAESLGLGSCYNGYVINSLKRNKNLRQKYRIPPENNVYSVIMLGYYDKRYIYEIPREEKKINILR